MAIEIERKFLVKNDDYLSLKKYTLNIKQGYFADGVRVRTTTEGDAKKAYITFKSPKQGITRNEFEYEIPFSDAVNILKMRSGPIIEKNRHIVYHNNEVWEVDEFLGKNDGLVVAELEMDSEDYKFENPNWLGKEVTYEKQYYNSHLTLNPFSKW